MKLSTTILAGSLALALTACGGGSENPVVSSQFDTAEYLGAWTRVDASTCNNGFRYGPYWFKNEGVTFTDKTLEATMTLYTDSACAKKAGKFVEKYNVLYSGALLTGKTNPLHVRTTANGFAVSKEDGTGVTLPVLPDGSQNGADTATGVANFLFDVDNGMLFAGDKKSFLDADGYPTQLQATALYKR